jgi:iron uptake system component EfeO
MTSRSSSVRPRRVRPTGTVTTLALLAIVTGACGGASASPTSTTAVPASRTGAGVTSRYGSAAGGPSAPTTVLAQTATHTFAVQVQDSAASFVNSVAALQADAARGDVASGRADELAAQGEYDGLRALDSGNSINASTLDELDTDVPAGQSFGGLHAVERDLWAGGPWAADVADLAGQAPVAQFLLSRERLGPEAIGQVAIDQLDWVVDTALPQSQEHVSHLGLIDVSATVLSARRSFQDVQPLAELVDPASTMNVAGQFVVLVAAVGALGPPSTTPDTSVSPAARLAVSRQLDATATSLARLAYELTPYGTTGAPS